MQSRAYKKQKCLPATAVARLHRYSHDIMALGFLNLVSPFRLRNRWEGHQEKSRRGYTYVCANQLETEEKVQLIYRAAPKPTLSLPTRREISYLKDAKCVRAPGKPDGRVHKSAFSAQVWSLNFDACTLERRSDLEQWAYITRFRAAKADLGKRAVIRNRAKRRVKAAANAILPLHAKRRHEYVIRVQPEALTIKFDDLKTEMHTALQEMQCWEEQLPDSARRRPKY